MPFYNFE